MEKYGNGIPQVVKNVVIKMVILLRLVTEPGYFSPFFTDHLGKMSFVCLCPSTDVQANLLGSMIDTWDPCVR